MKKRIARKKMIFVLVSLFVIGFFIGYDYAVLTTTEGKQASRKALQSAPSKPPAVMPVISDDERPTHKNKE